jgi:hypothetical protein
MKATKKETKQIPTANVIKRDFTKNDSKKNPNNNQLNQDEIKPMFPQPDAGPTYNESD